MICTPAERDLIVAGATQLVAPGDTTGGGCSHLPVSFVAPQRWVDATGPCPSCDGRHSWRSTERGSGPVRFTCLDCIDGRKREALQVDECDLFDCPAPRIDPLRLVTFAYATVEVLPVEAGPETGISVVRIDGKVQVLSPRFAGAVPGRDWVVLLDNVELT